VREHHGPRFPENGLLRLDVEVDEDVSDQHEIHRSGADPGIDEVELTVFDHAADVIADLPLEVELVKCFTRYRTGRPRLTSSWV
jgi:hypothetical protein